MPIPLIVLCAVLLFFAFLLSLRVRLNVRAGDTVVLELRILFIRIRLFPRKKRIDPRDYSPRRIARAKKKVARRDEKKAAKRAAKKAKKAEKHQKEHEEKESGVQLTLRDKIVLVRALCAVVIRHTHKHLRLHAARLHVRVATGDPATTAILYGTVSQSLSYLLTGLDRVTHLKAVTPDVGVQADFLGEKSHVDANVTFSIRVWGAIATAVPVLFAFLNKKRALKSARRKIQQQKTTSLKGN